MLRVVTAGHGVDYIYMWSRLVALFMWGDSYDNYLTRISIKFNKKISKEFAGFINPSSPLAKRKRSKKLGYFYSILVHISRSITSSQEADPNL